MSYLQHHGIKGMKWGVRKRHYTKSSSRGKIGVQFFAKKAKTRKTVLLKPSEYEHVMHEVATWITDDQKNSPVFSKNIGRYSYTFDDTGGSPRIISKKKIPGTSDIIYERSGKKQ